MQEQLITQRLSIVPTLRCTLNCKLCSNHMPNFSKPYDVALDEIIRDVDLALDLFDHIKWLQFVGGEIFVNKEMARVFEYCLTKKDEFDKLIVETNATLPLRKEEITALKKFGSDCEVMISDYGHLSRNRDEIVDELEQNGIPYRLKTYFGNIETQHFGGWLDNTGLRDYGESEEAVIQKAASCAQVRLENMHMFRGKLHRCSNSLFMTELGILTPNPGDYVDLTDDSMSREVKREIVKKFYSYPRKSCRYCTWKNANDIGVQRYPAAEQLPRKHM